jgi:uncharacterized protein YdhG (YjbR/CyaY superfamily)
MQSSAKSVPGYLKEIPENRKDAITALRKLCLELLKGYRETMQYGMPCYSRNGVGEVGFASQRNYVSIYILKQDVLGKYRARLQGASVGKCCIRYSNPERIDFGLIREMLSDTVKSESEIC